MAKTGSLRRGPTLPQLDSARSDGMVTNVATKKATDGEAKAAHLSGWHSYRLVKRCQTLEAAQEVMNQLKARGQSSQLVMDDGLSVVTQRN